MRELLQSPPCMINLVFSSEFAYLSLDELKLVRKTSAEPFHETLPCGLANSSSWATNQSAFPRPHLVNDHFTTAMYLFSSGLSETWNKHTTITTT
jgi:hypothetical protein